MNYQEFKKSYLKILTNRMAKLGFIKGKNDTPTYWCYPCDDKRLVWVVCFDFSGRGNPYFKILIGPYWMGYRLLSDDPFPRGVGYTATLGKEGVKEYASSWDAEEDQFELALNAIATHGIQFFSQFNSPQSLLSKEARGILAFDLGDYKLAYELFFRELINLYLSEYTLSAFSKAGKLMHKEDLQRTEAFFSETARFLSRESETAQRLLHAKGEAARRMINTLRNELRQDPKSRWIKSALKTCEDQVLASGLQIPKPRPQ